MDEQLLMFLVQVFMDFLWARHLVTLMENLKALQNIHRNDKSVIIFKSPLPLLLPLQFLDSGHKNMVSLV